MAVNLQETFNNFATLAFEHLRRMDGPSVVHAINTISKELSIDEHTTQQFLTNIAKYQEEAFYEQLRQKMLLMYQETSSLQYPNFPFFKPPIQTPVNSLRNVRTTYPQLIYTQIQSETSSQFKNELSQQIPSYQNLQPIPKLQIPKQTDSITCPFLNHAQFTNTNKSLLNQTPSKQQSQTQKSEQLIHKQINGTRKKSLFRTALVKTFNVQNESLSDLELCELVKESKTSRWKQVSRYTQCMSTKQVSDYFWKTFMNGAK
ncbi:Hypothetical_protein [Hexamita inflata]|uniref:Hypothetical_protein n=1 Tax=Hexamita inflata TaxID=28002 RepID=A0AA86UQM0_9EUKA|nr:Hypothetical protein HINF_LOCUS34878 [Hexamita inflata]